MTAATVAELADLVGGQVLGDGALRITNVADLRAAGPSEIGFVRDPKFAELAKRSRAGAVIVGTPLEVSMPQIVVSPADVAFAKIGLHFHPVPRATRHEVHPSAVIDDGAVLGEPVVIGPQCVVGARTTIGAGTLLAPGVIVGADVRIGRDCTIYPRVVIYPGVVLGDRVIVHAGAVLGSDGFGYARDVSGWVKIPQIGDVRIEDDVELGANVTIDRATLGTTRIGKGTKLDNLVHVGHNCVFGEHCAAAGFSAFSGSTIFGDRVVLGGHVVSAGHLRVVDDARIGGNSVLYGDVTEAGDFIGYPLQKKSRWGRTLHVLAQLPELQAELRRVKHLRRKLAESEGDPADPSLPG